MNTLLNPARVKPSQPSVNRPVIVLNSWKEISAYIGRSVRTVQRWECDLRLPVRRPHGRSRSAVIAMSDEIDAWLRSAPAAQECRQEKYESESIRNFKELLREHSDLRLQGHQLRANNARLLGEITLKLHDLISQIRNAKKSRLNTAA